jgi:hypothetical protein
MMPMGYLGPKIPADSGKKSKKPAKIGAYILFYMWLFGQLDILWFCLFPFLSVTIRVLSFKTHGYYFRFPDLALALL